MADYQLHLIHLYPKEMNIYGDTGNRLILQKRCEWRGIQVITSLVGVGDTIPTDADFVLGGGGQDAGQSKVQQDLQSKQTDIKKLADAGVVMLMVCGLYQLFGRKFVTNDQEVIEGIGILPLDTVAGPERLIGNTVYKSEWGELIGYENHSGLTELDDPTQALASVIQGAGNNGKDKSEGCRVHNVFGTYSHGPLLAKNPEFTDTLITLALQRKYGETINLEKLDDSLEDAAAAKARLRPR